MGRDTTELSAVNTEVILTEATRLLVEAAHPMKIILFGSYARGDFDKDSDFDLLVILTEVKDYFAESNRLAHALAPLRLPADVMVYSEQDVRERAHLPGSALRWALEEGRVPYAAS